MAIQKIIKKFCKSEFLTGLLRQLLCNLPRNDVNFLNYPPF
ncbi:transglycosylase SLT family protein [Rickettsia endosymbiont of Ixodes scapularis]|nr:transglycosylase SLT family protein [Rickettsia endosymbiont of Ixodes scapularis]